MAEDEANAAFREAIALAMAAELRGNKGVRLILDSTTVPHDQLVMALAGITCSMARHIGRNRKEGAISPGDVLGWAGRRFAPDRAPGSPPEMYWWQEEEG